ncbi:ubiquitin extension protein [Plasmopara halstedii]|uniref:Ubiquitin extension protein n=1 Tax=Plasmopara halstedii TaxID=4781 RepID=A0A0P1AI10_PLAHL|nr:ubiquitin extension protein [Plasmopara halstedii]CEG40361.1 ubiquitin extension protein [Plasmopara halstedii]|eukprot:XP_024576730.1 ubiquitin extension protein [Plasmopara halstedii]
MENGSLRETEHTSDYNEVSTPKLQEQMDKATDNQERQLDAVYSGVQRLRMAANATNEEVISQNAMLEHVSVQISDTEEAVQEQTIAARKVVSAHRKLFCYYVIIFVLAAALLVVIFI